MSDTHRAGSVSATYTIYVCPECGHWHGEDAGLWAKPSRCSRCVDRNRTDGDRLRGITRGSTVTSAPMTEPLVLTRLAP